MVGPEIVPPGRRWRSATAMRTYANELAQDLGRDGIRANVISPGATSKLIASTAVNDPNIRVS